jgi:hypothetical protein
MVYKGIILVCVYTTFGLNGVLGQGLKTQQGLLLKTGSDIRLGSVRVLNKRTRTLSTSNTIGVFSIQAAGGDTLDFTADNFEQENFIVTDFSDKVIYLNPIILLNEVEIKENALNNDINEVMRGYREKSVFYNGNPHYYYLVLKPMTFIYENFKSEKIFARRFAKYAGREITANKISARFNNSSIKAAVPIKDSELEDFKTGYTPTLAQLSQMSDYDLINYIKKSYRVFEKTGIRQRDSRI